MLHDSPTDAAWSPGARTLAVGLADGTLMLLERDPFARARRLAAHGSAVLAVGWEPSGERLASSGQDGAVLLWDAGTFSARAIHREEQWSEHLAFAGVGGWLAVATGRTLSLFDAAGERQYRHAWRGGALHALAWRPAATQRSAPQLVAAGHGGLALHQVPPTSHVQELPLAGDCLTACFDPMGRRLAAGVQDSAVHVWDLENAREWQMSGFAAAVGATVWGADGRCLATAAGSTLILWTLDGEADAGPQASDAPIFRAPRLLQGHSERVTRICPRPGTPWIASTGRDRRLLWWRTDGPDAPQDTHLLSDECTVLRFSADGAHLAVGDARGRLLIFDCEP